ncbi:MAG: hypothetical protein HPY51_13820 [Candidatus Omnitrophica bacterium]|nr:hypothetical protein [Candidatus Omnitrophota bacterium]
MPDAMEWREAISHLPGLYIRDQHPEGSGIAVSVEKRGDEQWVVHALQESQGRIKITESPPLPAAEVYRAIQKFYTKAGYTPVLADDELVILGLPRWEEIYQQFLSRRLPGIWLGAPREERESGQEWLCHYSVVRNPKGTYTLYSCAITDADDPLAEPEIDKAGDFNLSDLLDELRILGFKKADYASLLDLDALSVAEVAPWMPGKLLPADISPEKSRIVSICRDSRDFWKVFVAEKSQETRVSITEIANLDARQIYKKVHELLGIGVPPELRTALRLPPLEKLYAESLEKKLKGHWVGSVLGKDESGKPQERFVSLIGAGEDRWEIHYVKSEELISGNRKFPVHRAEPFAADDVLDALEKLDPVLDPLDLQMRMSESKFPEIIRLAKRFMEKMEE